MSLPRRYLPSISALRALEALDRLGSATAVADELNQTQSAVSRQLKGLEEQLDQSLFIRRNRRIVLTSAAQNYAADVRRALGQIAQASMKLSLNPAGGTVNLAILPTFGMRWLVPRLAEFSQAHPDVTVNFTSRLEPFNFATEPFDAAIYFGRPPWPGLEHLRLKSDSVLPVCTPELLAGRLPARPEDLLSLPLMHIATRPEAWAAWFAQYGVDGAHVTGTVHDQFSTLLQAALHGLGVALAPEYLVQADLASGRLSAAWGGPVESPGAYYLVWPVEKRGDAALMTFRRWLAGQAEAEDDPLPR
ncbi:LysR family transcriptional regulator [Roseovarius faecimaris]|uniref:LysR family transcriptional regulator n=1 Tax=Roseovarius faecimaris TaxID=2494550 RepID=A0A6I6J0U2_9RHOB|nr:LysR substrate-binding domain-containing protein [Roseovarius faecimaris]QGX98408.1 LysR family transcriptional regulator [Roseovarius faecimaris]